MWRAAKEIAASPLVQPAASTDDKLGAHMAFLRAAEDCSLGRMETALGWRREPNRTAAAEARHHSDRRGELGVQNGRGRLTHFSPASHVSAAGRNATRCWGWSALTASQQRQLIAATRADGQLYEQAF